MLSKNSKYQLYKKLKPEQFQNKILFEANFSNENLI